VIQAVIIAIVKDEKIVKIVIHISSLLIYFFKSKKRGKNTTIPAQKFSCFAVSAPGCITPLGGKNNDKEVKSQIVNSKITYQNSKSGFLLAQE
jgi:hypothetical protein